MNRKILSMLLAIVMVLSLLAGCSNSTGAPGNDNASSTDGGSPNQPSGDSQNTVAPVNNGPLDAEGCGCAEGGLSCP